ncbi:hypothetical protein AB0F93_00325 [Micromonospora tulbaghiae]|uniref:hypothetical protein n=1 Tax=Micromonospora tulbaghiae TaxID=479978 RepID=UPI00331DD861
MRLESVPELVELRGRVLRARPALPAAEVDDALLRAWQAGAQAEADCRTEGRTKAALDVAEFVHGIGQHAERAGEDRAYFAGLAAEIYFAGQPLRRRLGLVWRLLRPRTHWRGYAAWRARVGR